MFHSKNLKKLLCLIISSIISSIILSKNLYADNYYAILDSKNFKVEASVIEPVEEAKEDSMISITPNTLSLEALTDGVYNCSVAGTITTAPSVEIDLDSPQLINYLDSAGMGRLWQYPLYFEGLTSEGYIPLGYIQTSGYCMEDQKTRITFPDVEITKIRISTPERIYIGELEFGYTVD